MAIKRLKITPGLIAMAIAASLVSCHFNAQIQEDYSIPEESIPRIEQESFMPDEDDLDRIISEINLEPEVTVVENVDGFSK